MNIKEIILLLIWAMFFCIPIAQASQNKPFPLSKGNYWIYEGYVKNRKNDRLEEKKVTWKMEVKEVKAKDNVEVVILKGHPSDLPFYEEGREPQEYLIVIVENKKFYLLNKLKMRDFLERFATDPEQALSLLDGQWDLFLAWPLNEGFCESGDFRDPKDWLGRCTVEEDRNIILKRIKGENAKERQMYRLAQRDNTGHTFIDFVPEVGITHYVYGHNGTLSEVDVEMIEFHQGVN